MVVGWPPEVVAGRVFTLEGVTTVRVTVLVGCDEADAAGWVTVVVLPVVAGRVVVGVADVVADGRVTVVVVVVVADGRVAVGVAGEAGVVDVAGEAGLTSVL